MLRKGKNGQDDIYVVGCGLSLKKFDWSFLEDKTTIAVNGSLQDVPNPDYFITADSAVAIRAASNIFWGTKANTILVMGNDHPKFKEVSRHVSCFDHRIVPRRFDGELSLSESEFATGQNSGFCGMQMAAILGAKRIHLLGIDLNSKGDYKNYHARYTSVTKQFDEFYLHFCTGIYKLKNKYKVQVISHSSISRLNNIIEYWELNK